MDSLPFGLAKVYSSIDSYKSTETFNDLSFIDNNTVYVPLDKAFSTLEI